MPTRRGAEDDVVETWDDAVDGDTLAMALEGKLGRADSVQETFHVTGPGELTQTSETSFIACGGCQSGAVWLAR